MANFQGKDLWQTEGQGACHLLHVQSTPVLMLPYVCCTGAAAIPAGGALSPEVSTAPTTLPTAGVRYRIQLVGRSNCPDQSEWEGARRPSLQPAEGICPMPTEHSDAASARLLPRRLPGFAPVPVSSTTMGAALASVVRTAACWGIWPLACRPLSCLVCGSHAPAACRLGPPSGRTGGFSPAERVHLSSGDPQDPAVWWTVDSLPASASAALVKADGSPAVAFTLKVRSAAKQTKSTALLLPPSISARACNGCCATLHAMLTLPSCRHLLAECGQQQPLRLPALPGRHPPMPDLQASLCS